jgi:hypothetical protein
MTAKLKVVPNKQRETIAQAVVVVAAAHRAATKAREAKERAQAMIVAAETKILDAGAGIEQARDTQAADLAKAATFGAKPRADSGMHNARIWEACSRDTLEAAKAAKEICEQTLADRDHDLTKAQDRAAAAADDIIRSEAASRVLKDAQALQEKLIVARVALRCLYNNDMLPEQLMQEAKTLLGFRAFPAWLGHLEIQRWEIHEAHRHWLTLREELMKDANAVV